MNIQRRRAMVVSGVALALAAAVGGGLALANSDQPVALRPAATTVPTSTTAVVPLKPVEVAPPPVDAVAQVKTQASVLDHFGYQGLKLGMNRDNALDTGLITTAEPVQGAESCTSHDLVEFPNSVDEISLYISDSIGVSTIFADRGMRTSEGVGIGSTLTDVKAAYPNIGDPIRGQYISALGDNPHARYVFVVDRNSRVQSFSLTRDDQRCHN